MQIIPMMGQFAELQRNRLNIRPNQSAFKQDAEQEQNRLIFGQKRKYKN